MIGRARGEITRAKWENPLLSGRPLEGQRQHDERPWLDVVVERTAGRTTDLHHVHAGEICRIGSHASNDVVLDDPTISRFHCRIMREGRTWRISDTSSRNGTRLAGVRIREAVLDQETAVEIGDSVLIVRPMSPSIELPKPDVVAARPHEPEPRESGEIPVVGFRAAKEAVVATFERDYVGALLERCHGNVSDAARRAGMDRMHLHRLARKHGLRAGSLK